MSSSIRCRSGEISRVESFIVLLRLRYEAECLNSQLTKQHLSGQPLLNARSKPPLPRERFSPVADQRPILRVGPAVPRNLTGKFSRWPAMCQVDPSETLGLLQ